MILMLVELAAPPPPINGGGVVKKICPTLAGGVVPSALARKNAVARSWRDALAIVSGAADAATGCSDTTEYPLPNVTRPMVSCVLPLLLPVTANADPRNVTGAALPILFELLVAPLSSTIVPPATMVGT